jgi:monofunctional biosynthetic peptidoglycan transglycosylase
MNWIKYLVAAPLACIVLFNVWAYGNILSYRAIAPYRTSFMSMRMDELAAEKPNVALDYRWVPYTQISVNLKKALIASEDAGFAEHSGFDWNGIKNAMQRNERSGKIRAGGSTISQQLAKNLFLNESRSYFRKAEEAVLTSMLEATTDKDRLYELYLNVIEWGYGIYGAEAAAQHWHRKSAAELTKAQAAELAARVPRPLYYADHPRDAALKRKTNIILRRMGSAELPE